ncbi:TonB-dependent receptor plug domain-containing protein [Synoicihabitans lomoniglobus]|uniref:TonB-dependent receptor plug domain-containing protein n=1 Tax=Synoicihabitans lomoniglobus TaxID=2909285 RepID=A0AAE9ZW38_9BACT|nr:TonB-dependent receptor plug domain-containing protein [Opitutaceae bacterium LMO-M01]WED64254.1 TonB-dependent receptor plug domain-containing protein [Opitutaceae bacterium LMO-M01]
MQRTTQPWSRRGRLPRALLALALAAPAFAQSANDANTGEENTEEDIVTLTPFQVDSSKDQGYFAQNTLAGSRMRTNIADLASSITVVTAQQLEDTASVDINDVFRYEANTEGSSTYTPSVQSLRNDGVVDVNAGYTHGGDGNAQTNAGANRVRGLGAPSSSQNFYPTNSQVPFDAYNVQSIEISRGPNSMLFGMGSPAGIVNQTTAQAVLNADAASVAFRVDDRGSYRGSFTFNKALIDDKLAIYGAGVSDNTRFERKPSYDDTTRFYGALTFRPFEKTVIRASVEQYENDNRRPNTLTPRDSVTQWRAGGGWGFDAATGMQYSTVTGESRGPIAMRTGSPRIDETRAYIENMPGYNASLWNADRTQYNGANIYGGSAFSTIGGVFFTPGMGTGNGSRPKMQIQDGQVVNYNYYPADRYRTFYGEPDGPIFPYAEADIFANPAWDTAYNSTFTQSSFWTGANNGVGSYRYPGVTDKTIYDWENINLLQMNFAHKENTTFNVELEQEILPSLNFSAGWFRQDFEDAVNYTVSQLNVATIYVDTNISLPNGSPNPFFGQPYVNDFDPDQFVHTEVNDNFRALLAWTPDFTDNDGFSKWFGRHQVLGLWSRNDVSSTFIRKRWFEVEDDQIENNTIFWASNPADAGWNRQRRSSERMFYLANPGSAPLGNVTRASGEFNDLTVNTRRTYYDYGASSWSDLGTTMGFIDMDASLNGSERIVDSSSIGITSNLWNDRLVTTFGVRKDEYKARNSTADTLLDGIGGTEIAPKLTNAEKWVNGELQTDLILNRWNFWEEVAGTTRTTGAVLRPFKNWSGIEERAANGSQFHQFISSLGFSYNKSDNFNPPPKVQVDAFGSPLPKPTGVGEDWGVQFSLFDNKLFARVNWFKASNQDERTNPGTSISRLNGNIDTSLFRAWARELALINRGLDPVNRDDFNTNDWSQADLDALDAETAAIWGQPFDYYSSLGGEVYATRDAVAEGVEVQLTYNPSRNWTMKFTAGQQETKYSDVLKEFDAWKDVRYPVWTSASAADHLDSQYQQYTQPFLASNGIMYNYGNFWSSYGYDGNIRIENANNVHNPEDVYNRDVAPQIAIASDLEGQAAPGQRKYRWSYLTNYSFDEGVLKGASVGGSTRWEDKAIMGYYGKINPGTGSTDLALSDTTRPIYDSSNMYVDLWVSYTTKIFNDRVTMKTQLNVVNVFESGGLQTVGVNYDGSPNAYRIVDPRQFILSTKFSF